MAKLHVIFKKEDIHAGDIDDEKVVVVFDVLLATTTIATLLYHGATEVIPVASAEEALLIKEGIDEVTTIYAGESYGVSIDGFVDPFPTRLQHKVTGKTVVLSTTNGTVALRKVAHAKKVYAGSLVNGDCVAQKIATDHRGEAIVVVCSGSRNRFSLEDFYGAGYLIHKLFEKSVSWELTDAAKAALYFYEGNEEDATNLLKIADTGQMLIEMGCEEDVLLSARKGTIAVVPELEDGKMIVKSG